MPSSQNIRVNSRVLNKRLQALPTCFPFLSALDKLALGSDSFEPGRRSFSENERIVAGEIFVVIQIKVQVFYFSNSHYITIC